MSETKKHFTLDIHYHFKSSMDATMRFRVMAKARGLSQSAMFEEMVTFYWDHCSAKAIPMKGSTGKIKKIILKVLRKAAG